MHQTCEPAILYFGTPVVLISTCNKDGSYNLAPISSVFWLGWRCIIGIAVKSKTTENLIRTKECVLNLPSVDEAAAVNALALTTGSKPVPEGKRKRGYRFEPDKFELSGLSPISSELVSAPGAEECPVLLEAKLAAVHPVGEDDELLRGRIVNIELEIVRVRVEEGLLSASAQNHIDPDKWRPLIMSFQQFYGLGKMVHPSKLAEVRECLYRGEVDG